MCIRDRGSPMHPSNIVRLGALCAGLVAVGCGFSPGKPVSGTGGTGNIHISTGGGGIALDASGSMNDDATNTSCGNMGCGAMSKWALMTPAINQVVTDTQAEVNWGLKFFADSGSCGVNNNAAVPVAVNNSAAIGTAICLLY